MTESFVYCWTDIGTNKLYVGVHKGTPNDGYVCSSKLMKEEYQKRPQEFSRQIIARGTFQDCYALETAILKSVGADKDPGFYNQHNNNGKFAYGPHTEEWKKNHSDKMKIVYDDPKRKKQISNFHRGKKHRLGKKESLSSRNKKRMMRIGKTHSEETKTKIGNGNSKWWRITTPFSEIVDIKNLSSYCYQHKLSKSHMSHRGKSRGYLCERLVK